MKTKRFVIAFCSVIVLFFTACGNSADNIDTDKKTDIENIAHPPNNFSEYENLNTAMDVVGFHISVPDTIDGYTERIIRASQIDGIIEVIYRNDRQSIHIRKSTKEGDVSGNDNKFDENGVLTINAMEVTTKGSAGKVNVAFWMQNGYTYSIDSSEALEEEAITELINVISMDLFDGDENDVQLSNPWKAFSTIKEAEKYAGFDVSVPESMDGYSTKTIQVNTTGTNKIIEVIYHNGDENENKIRIRKALGMEDISGDYNTYEQTNIVSVGSLNVTMKGNDDRIDLAIWENEGYTYSVSVNTGLSGSDMTEIVSYIQ